LKRRKNESQLGLMLLLAIIVGAVIYVYNSKMFERNAPEISINNSGYWNLKDPLDVSISDNSGLKSYKITLKSETQEVVLHNEQFITPQLSVHAKVEPPKSAYIMKEKEITIVVEAHDVSKWDFFKGNIAKSEFKLIIDKKRPYLNVIANSYKITRGGSALVIFKLEDENLKNFYIQTSFDKKFIAQPFYKKGYYIALLAWPIKEENFKAVIVAEDYAQNIAQGYIPLYLTDKKYKTSNIKLDDKFLKGKIAELSDEFAETNGVTDSIEQFKIINEKIREKNEKLIHEITSKVSDESVIDFSINEMYPLKNAAVVAHFGDHRIYSYDGKDVSESYHLGLDLASNAMAEIKPQNGGKVVFAGYNGLYGNMPILHHGLGLYTLYGHCSTINVSVDENVKAGANIANTGKSGYAMGDHLHFGVLVQGIEVRPAEWMDTEWMKLNIADVIKSAKEIIDRG